MGAAQSLNSPWDVVLDPQGKAVLFAMAGQHQIWRYDIASGVAGVRAGGRGAILAQQPLRAPRTASGAI